MSKCIPALWSPHFSQGHLNIWISLLVFLGDDLLYIVVVLCQSLAFCSTSSEGQGRKTCSALWSNKVWLEELTMEYPEGCLLENILLLNVVILWSSLYFSVSQNYEKQSRWQMQSSCVNARRMQGVQLILAVLLYFRSVKWQLINSLSAVPTSIWSDRIRMDVLCWGFLMGQRTLTLGGFWWMGLTRLI